MRRLMLLLLGVALPLAGCMKPTTLDPYANPGRKELDRLQKIVNQRTDLETTEQQLANLNSAIEAAIAKYSPQTQFSSTKVDQSTNGCNDPFNRSIGRQEKSDNYSGQPAPTSEQWLQIVTELAPVFSAAGFRPNNSAPGTPPPPLGNPNDSQNPRRRRADQPGQRGQRERQRSVELLLRHRLPSPGRLAHRAATAKYAARQ